MLKLLVMKVPFIKDVIVVVVVEINNNYRELAFINWGKSLLWKGGFY